MNEDLIYTDIIALIKAYEKGLFKKMKTDPTDEDVKTSSLTTLLYMESTILTNIKSSEISFVNVAQNIIDNNVLLQENKFDQNEFYTGSTDNDLANNLETQTFALNPNAPNNPNKSTKKEKEFSYAECSITDVHGDEATFINEDKRFKVRSNVPLSSSFNENEPIKYTARSRLTNDWEASYTAKINGYIKNKTMTDNGKYIALDKCLNCMLNVKLALALPALEVIFDFSKILNEFNRLLDQLVKDLDPTKFIQMICQFLISFGKNFSCPQNLIGIQLLLPTLFAKYSFDLLKFRLDWTALLGPILSSLLTFLVSALENIPKITNALLDCLINTIVTVLSALQSIASSVDKIANETAGAVERAGNFVYRNADRIGAAFSEVKSLFGDSNYYENNSAFTETGQKRIESQINQLNKELKEELGPLLKTKKQSLWANEATKSFLDYLMKNSDSTKDPLDLLVNWYNSLTKDDSHFKSIFSRYLFDNEEPHLYKQFRLSSKIKNISDITEKYYNKINSKKRELSNITEIRNTKYFKAIYTAEDIARDKITYKPRGNAFSAFGLSYQPYLFEKRKGQSKGSLEYGLNAKPNKNLFTTSDWLLAAHNVTVKNNYKPVKAFDIPTVNTRKFVDQKIIEPANRIILKKLRQIKNWVNSTIGSLIMALKALNQFMSEAFDGEFKLLGEIQELLHLIRFVNMIIYMVENGLSTCEDIKTPTGKNILAKALENQWNYRKLDGTQYPLFSIGSNELVASQGYNPDDYILVKSTTNDNQYAYLDLNECSKYEKHINVNNDAVLDTIYEAMAAASQGNGEL